MASRGHVDPAGLDSEHDYADLEEERYSNLLDRTESVPRSRELILNTYRNLGSVC